jgi:hypothetical protein
MQPQASPPSISADDVGIHFLGSSRNDIIVHWGEIAEVCALRDTYADGTPFIEVYIDHFSGVDFRFHSVEAGYEQTTAEMEKRLIGFRRAALEAVRTFEEEGETIPVVWKRDEALQPFQLQPLKVDTREPTSEERAQMERAHQASITTCEKILGRSLTSDELACINTGFENGRIVGNIAPPLCDLLLKHQGGG